MAETQTTEKTASKPKLTGEALVLARATRRRKKTEGRNKRTLKLRTDKEFAKTFFEARSKRANDKKAAFRKKKSRKK